MTAQIQLAIAQFECNRVNTARALRDEAKHLQERFRREEERDKETTSRELRLAGEKLLAKELRRFRKASAVC